MSGLLKRNRKVRNASSPYRVVPTGGLKVEIKFLRTVYIYTERDRIVSQELIVESKHDNKSIL